VTADAAPSAEEVGRRAERLKERVYVTFAALAVVIALRDHLESPGAATRTLAITVGGTLLAVLVADLVSHVVVHQALPDRDELRHMLSVTRSGLLPVVLPLLYLAMATAGIWSVGAALRASTIALVVTLVVIGWAAARRLRLTLVQRLVVLGAEGVLGVGVVLLELAAHR
jgi:hypothetical protein